MLQIGWLNPVDKHVQHVHLGKRQRAASSLLAAVRRTSVPAHGQRGTRPYAQCMPGC
jgi:hypothetical protein